MIAVPNTAHTTCTSGWRS